MMPYAFSTVNAALLTDETKPFQPQQE